MVVPLGVINIPKILVSSLLKKISEHEYLGFFLEILPYFEYLIFKTLLTNLSLQTTQREIKTLRDVVANL